MAWACRLSAPMLGCPFPEPGLAADRAWRRGPGYLVGVRAVIKGIDNLAHSAVHLHVCGRGKGQEGGTQAELGL